MKRMIGIDLGTSSSMIKTKEYQDAGAPGTAALDCKAVVFTQNEIATTPTLIRERGENRWYGYDAEQNLLKGSTLYKNFKIDLKSRDDQIRARAVALTEDFFGFLYRNYAPRRQFLFDLINEPLGDEETMVSYPAQWDEAQRDIVLKAARKAGFVNVHGMDEATACVHCILNVKKTELIEKKLLQAGKPLKALIIDMGAGTADLAFVRITLDGDLKTEILGTWPPAESQYIFGGSRMDELLSKRMEQWLEDSGVKQTIAKNIVAGQRFAIKRWKETVLSPLLASRQAVDDCAEVSGMCASWELELKPFPVLDRESFERDFQAYLETFVSLVNSAPKSLRDETQILILTGGNSQWYWIDEALTGANARFGQAGLPQIEGHPELLLRMELPTETVARGLVYSQLPLEVREQTAEPCNKVQELSQYVKRHIALDSTQAILLHANGRISATKTPALDKLLGKSRDNFTKYCDIQELYSFPGALLLRGKEGEFFETVKSLSGRIKKLNERKHKNPIPCDISEFKTLSVCSDLTIEYYDIVVNDETRACEKLVQKAKDIREASFFGRTGILCLTRAGKLFMLNSDPEKVERYLKLMRDWFSGEVDDNGDRMLFGSDIAHIKVDPLGNTRFAVLKNNGRVACYGQDTNAYNDFVENFEDIIDIDYWDSSLFMLRKDGSLFQVAGGKHDQSKIILENCIGFVCSMCRVLAATRDGRLHYIGRSGDEYDHLIIVGIENWNLFD